VSREGLADSPAGAIDDSIPPATEVRARLWDRAFALVCISNFLSYGNQTMLTPVLPLFLVSLGYTPSVVGLAITVFSITSLVGRPWIGLLVDRSSPRRAYTAGALITGAATFVLVVPNLAVLLASRAAGGVGWGAINTAGTAMAADLAPASRRGEALGYFTMMISVARAVMAAVGLWLAAAVGYWFSFVIAGIFSLIAAGTAAIIRERRSGPAEGPRNRRDLIPERGVILPTVLVTILNCTTPIATAFIVLYAADVGVADVWILFVASGIASLSVRWMGRLSDRFGRIPILSLGLAVAGVGLLLMLAVPTLAGLIVGAVGFAAGQGLITPAALAMVVDATPAGRRGVAMAYYTSSYPLGMAVGGLVWGVVIEASGFAPTYALGGGLLIVSGVALSIVTGFRRSEPSA
jgi:MFS family permease